jgi:Zn-dependent metalloprotease
MQFTRGCASLRAVPRRITSRQNGNLQAWRRTRWVAGSVAAVIVANAGAVGAVGAMGAPGELTVRTSRATGVARFVTSAKGDAIDVPLAPGRQQAEPLDFFRAYGQLFGVTDPDRQLVVDKTATDALGYTHTTFQQVHEGVPVFAALLRVHFDAQERLMAVNGTFIPDINVNATPVLSADEAAVIALAEVSGQLEQETDLKAVRSKLYVFRANLARGVPGPNHLVYEVEVGNGADVREFIYVDAHKGYVVDQITGIHEALHRRVYDGGFGEAFLVWEEGDFVPYPGSVDINHLIEYSKDTYNLVASATDEAFLSWDGVDGIMHSVNDAPISCPNASWNGTSTNYCIGVTGDDTVAHEWGHAYTDSTHNLIYQWQSGALNEAYSDIFGEVVDFLNGDGTDWPIPLRGTDGCSTYGGSPPPLCEINSPPGIAGRYPAAGASFNPLPPITMTGNVELVDDGDVAPGDGTVTDGCQPLIGFTPNNIALIDRGTCAFVNKVNNATAAGAVGVIIVNNDGDSVSTMSGPGTLAIPSVIIGQTDGEIIKGELPGVNATITLAVSADNSYRWLQGEDDPSFGGAIRDMWNPTCYGDPGKVSDRAQYYCGTADGGGVHTNSGVANHAFALLADGGVYNGETITGIGLTKAFHIYWRAETIYQVPSSGFADHADALEQSCQDLIGVNLFDLSATSPFGVPSGEIISTADCAELADAIAAVELREEPVQCAFSPMLDPDAPPICDGPGTLRRILAEDWEGGIGSWTVGTRDVYDTGTFDTPDWAVVGSLPDGRAGSAAFVADLLIGDCMTDVESGVLFLESPVIAIPAGADVPRIAFDHWVATELLWDGGNIKISVNGGAWELIPPGRFDFNAYSGVLNFGGSIGNPLWGEAAFTGTDGGAVSGSWGQSQLNLAGMALPGDDVQLRFEMGLDGCNGVHGWYVDEVSVYYCCDLLGDVECDGNVNLNDYATFADCLSGPYVMPDPPLPVTPSTCLDTFDADADDDVDLSDFAVLQTTFTGE